MTTCPSGVRSIGLRRDRGTLRLRWDLETWEGGHVAICRACASSTHATTAASVPTCPLGLRAHLPTWPPCPRAHVPTCPPSRGAPRAAAPAAPRRHRGPPYAPCPPAYRAHAPTLPRYPRAGVPTARRAHATHRAPAPTCHCHLPTTPRCPACRRVRRRDAEADPVAPALPLLLCWPTVLPWVTPDDGSSSRRDLG
jgi:hypothetical protein